MGGRLAAGKGGAVGGRKRGGGWRQGKGGAVGGREKGRRLIAHRAAVDSSQGGG